MADDQNTSRHSPPTRQGNLPDQQRPPTSGMAIASLILGLAGFVTCFTSVIGLILGIVSLRRIRVSNGKLGGNGVAIAGISISSASILISGLMTIFLLIALMLPALGKAREAAQGLRMQAEALTLAQAMTDYHINNNSLFPPADDWRAALEDDAEAATGDDMLVLPAGFSMNEALGGLYAYDVLQPERTVLFFETPQGSTLAGGRELLSPQPQFFTGFVIVFVDAHVDQVPIESLDDLIWEPVRKTE